MSLLASVILLGLLNGCATTRPGTGDISFRLLWDGTADLDLHAEDPHGRHVGTHMNNVGVTDQEALARFHRLTRLEGILPALESSHAVAYGMQLASAMRPDQTVLVNLSGRGDKDVHTVAELEGITL